MLKPKKVFLSALGHGYHTFLRWDLTHLDWTRCQVPLIRVQVQGRLWLWAPLVARPHLKSGLMALDLEGADVISVN